MWVPNKHSAANKPLQSDGPSCVALSCTADSPLGETIPPLQLILTPSRLHVPS